VLATMLVPVGIAYAVASGVLSAYGPYATIISLLAYALFGPSRAGRGGASRGSSRSPDVSADAGACRGGHRLGPDPWTSPSREGWRKR
jgi:Sulfate permease family